MQMTRTPYGVRVTCGHKDKDGLIARAARERKPSPDCVALNRSTEMPRQAGESPSYILQESTPSVVVIGSRVASPRHELDWHPPEGEEQFQS